MPVSNSVARLAFQKRPDWFLKGYLLLTSAYGMKHALDLDKKRKMRIDTLAAIFVASPLLWPAYVLGNFSKNQ